MTATAPLICVVDDDEAFRDSLRWLLEAANYSVAEYATGEHFLATFDTANTACIVMDVRMPGMSGITLQEELQNRGHAIPIVFVTGHGDVPMAVNAIKKGAVDFIEKPFDDMSFLALIESALKPHDSLVAGGGHPANPIAGRLASLTQREREVMNCMVAGKRNKMIADELGISIKTVEAHRAQVMLKSGATSIAELVQIVLGA